MGGGGWLDLIFFMHMVLTIARCCCCLWWPMWRRRRCWLSGRDPLTGVLNRRGLFRQEGLRLARRGAWWSWTSIASKRVNDQFGQWLRDEVIRYVAGCWWPEVRKRTIWWAHRWRASSPSSWEA